MSVLDGKPFMVKAEWSVELAKDLELYHPIDAEAKLTALLEKEIGEQYRKNISDILFTQFLSIEDQCIAEIREEINAQEEKIQKKKNKS